MVNEDEDKQLGEYQRQKQEKLQEQQRSERWKTAKKFLRYGIWILILAGIAGGVFWYLNRPLKETDITNLCVQHQRVGMHIHPHLSIKIKGQEEKIPANIGISPACMRPIHTHDSTGTLHLEFPRPLDVKLGDFFQVWGKTFNREQILDKVSGPEGQVKMLVNGQANTEFENYIMKDKDRIEIIFE